MTDSTDDPIGAIAENSPLKEVSYKSVDEFLSRDPFEFGIVERREIVRILRDQRALWERLEAEGKKVPKASRGKSQTPPVVSSLEDLGLA